VKLLAKADLKVKRQRHDFHHQAALQGVRQYDTIYFEDLRVRTMVRTHHLAKSIAAAGWRAFLTILTFKAAGAGKRVHAVEPAYTSQKWSGPNCGEVVWKGLSVRWHECSHCGTSLHRDHNAARNILALGSAEQKAVGGAPAVGRQRGPLGRA
jgi:putative transposase